MKLYTHEEMLDRVLGIQGTPDRDNYEEQMNSYLVGEAIREARKSKNLLRSSLEKSLE